MEPHPNATMDSLDAAGVEANEPPAPDRMTTDRLVLRRVHPDEVEFDRLHALFADADEGVFELCGWDAHESEADTRAYLDRTESAWARGESYEYVLETVADGEYVGMAVLEISDDDGDGEFGLWLRKPHWGHGFSGEATDALVHLAFQRLGAPFVVIGCRPENDRSRRAIEKIVRRYDGAYFGSPPILSGRSRTDEGDVVVPHHEWVITAEQFASGDRGLSTLVPGVEYDDLDF